MHRQYEIPPVPSEELSDVEGFKVLVIKERINQHSMYDSVKTIGNIVSIWSEYGITIDQGLVDYLVQRRFNPNITDLQSIGDAFSSLSEEGQNNYNLMDPEKKTNALIDLVTTA